MSIMTVTVMTADEARSLTDRIKAHVAELLPLIKEAFEGRADLALGYASWPEYCDAELRGLRLPVVARREAVADLRETGMSTRAIGAALGVDHKTVVGDLKSTGEYSPVEKVTSLDGRERPASRPSTPDPQPVEDRPKPPKWDPADRKAHEEEALRLKDIEAARQQIKTLVPDVRALIFTVLQGTRQPIGGLITADMVTDLRRLITREMVADLRRAVELLEGELSDEA